jgi:hypothetical protein
MTELPSPALQRARLNAETAKLPWMALQRFFAAGRVIYVAPELDLVEVAVVIARDCHETLGPWTRDRRVLKVSDAQAREWVAANALMWSVVVKPWVLVQPVLAAPAGRAPPGESG